VGLGKKLGGLPRGAKVALDDSAEGMDKSNKPYRVVRVLPSPVSTSKHEGEQGFLNKEHLLDPQPDNGGDGEREMDGLVQGARTHNTQGQEEDEHGDVTLTPSPLEQQSGKPTSKKDKRLDTLDSTVETGHDMSTQVNFVGLKLKNKKSKLKENERTQMAEMEGGGNLAAGFLGMVKGVRSFQKAKGVKKLEGMVDVVSSMSKVGRGVSQVLNSGDEATTPAGKADAILGTIGGSLDSLKKGALAIRDLFKKKKSKKKPLADLGIESLNIIKTGVVAASSLLAACNKVGASKAVGKFVAPLGIAIDIATAIKQFWLANKAASWEKEMGEGELVALGKMEDALEDTLSGQDVALSDVLVKEKRGVFFFRKRYDRVNPWVLAKLREHDWSEGDCELALGRRQNVSITAAQYRRIQEYEFASKMYEINRTRKVKGRASAVKSLVKATAKAVGIGAPVVGIALESAIAAGELLYAGGKLVQKAYRNKRGKGVRNAISTSNTMEQFKAKKKGPDQSTHQKRIEYAQHAKFLFQTLAALPEDPVSQEDLAKYQHAERYVKSTGVDTEELYAETDPEEQFKLLVKAMGAR